MASANIVIKQLKNKDIFEAQPVIRHGQPVNIFERVNNAQFAKLIKSKIENYREKGFKSFAIIYKNIDGCKAFYKEFSKIENNINLITFKDMEYNGNISIVPSFLAKGLEFDVVFIADSEAYKNNDLDIRLL
jgi:DNA helicase-2/ATP-dependent DNA helicase PcrA